MSRGVVEIHMLQTDTVASGSDLVRRCSEWQGAWPGAKTVFPARLLAFPAVAKWLRNQVRGKNARVGARNEQELALVVSAGINPAWTVFYCDNAVVRAVWHAVGLNVGCFVVIGERQVLTISACAPSPQRVLVDVTPANSNEVLAAVLAAEGLELTGLHCQLDAAGPTGNIDRIIGQTAQFSRDNGAILSLLNVAVSDPTSGSPDAVRALAAAVDDALDESCRRRRFPRPAVIVSPQWQALAGRAETARSRCGDI